VAAGATGAQAASEVFADLAGGCNGASPCFLTIQEAVDHAGPGPASVGIFPGLYAESVDLSTMGSAVGGGPADLLVQALDAGGAPATAGVAVDPGAVGGPGAGVAMLAGPGFAGAITLRGLHLTSPDLLGFGLFTTGDVAVEHVEVASCGSLGGAVETPGHVRLTSVEARLNTGTGVAALAGTIVAEDVLADRNDGYGVRLFSQGALALAAVTATANGEGGIEGSSCTQLTAEDLVAELNGDHGIALVADLGSCAVVAAAWMAGGPAPSGSLQARLAEGLAALSLGAGEIFPRGVPVTALNATGLRALGNGGHGIALGTQGRLEASGLEGRDNAFNGAILLGGEAALTGATLTGNTSGLAVFADGSFTVAQVVASDQAPAAYTPPLEGAGVVVASLEGGSLDGIVAERNAFAGVVLLTPPVPVASPSFTVADSRFADNFHGLVTSGDTPAVVTLTDLEAEGNTAAGLALPNLGTGEVRRATSHGNGYGILAHVQQTLQVLESEIADNVEGVALAVEAGAEARVSCSNLRGNASSGLRMLAGAAADARGNFWGAPSGPTHPGNPGGTGDLVTDGANGGTGVVDYAGFLLAAATAADCPQQVAVLEIPTAGEGALAALALLLALGALPLLRRP
jgi:hypothetical protein